MKIHFPHFVFLIFFLTLFFPFVGIAQSIEVLSIDDKKPISKVLIFNADSSKVTLTDTEGKADISTFNLDEKIYLTHIIFQSQQTSKQQLSKNEYQIFLTEKVNYLDEIVFSANKSETSKSDLPIRLETLTAQEIRLNNPQTSADILAKSGGVFVQKSQAGGGSPVLRGFEANRVLLVIDGIRMNNAIYRSGHLQNIITIDPNIIQRAEVVFGPSSVMYGSDALGGVMHFSTRNPEITGEKLKLHGGGFLRYSSANNEQSLGLDLEYSHKNIAGLTHVTFSQFGDIKTGKQGNQSHIENWKRHHYQKRINQQDSMFQNSNSLTQIGTAYEQFDVMQKFLYQPHDNNQYSFNFQYSTSSNIPRYERINEYLGNNLKYAEWHYSPQKRLLFSARADFKDLSHFYDDASVILGVQNIEEGRITRRFDSSIRNVRIENVQVYSINIDLTKKIKESHFFTYGLESFYNKVHSKAHTENVLGGEQGKLSTRYPDGGSEMQSFALYLNHRQVFNNLGKVQFIFSQGLRYNYISLTSIFEDKTFFPLPFSETTLANNALSGNLGLVLKFNDNVNFTLNSSTGFRAPNVDDMGKIFDSEPSTVIVPNPNLKPEYTYNIESSLRGKILQKIQFNLTGFYTYLDNAIIRNDFLFNGEDSIIYDGVLSKVLANVNAEEAILYGWQFDLSHNIGQFLEVRHQLAQTFGEVRSRNEPLAHIPPLYGKSSITWNYQNWAGDFFVLYNGKKALSKYSPSSIDRLDLATPEGMPAWMTWNTQMTYRFRNFTGQFAIENIFDRHYRVFGSGLSAMGRNFVITFRANF